MNMQFKFSLLVKRNKMSAEQLLTVQEMWLLETRLLLMLRFWKSFH